MGTDLASRLRARFSKRRHSATTTTSLTSTGSGAETSSLKSQHRDRDHSSLNTASQTGSSTPLAPSQVTGADSVCRDDLEHDDDQDYHHHGDEGSPRNVADADANTDAHWPSKSKENGPKRPASSPVGGSTSAGGGAETPVAFAGLQQQQSRRLLLGANANSSDLPGNDLHPPLTAQTQPQLHPYPPQPSPSLSLPPTLTRSLDSIHEDSIADRPQFAAAFAAAATAAAATSGGAAAVSTPAGHELDALNFNSAPTPAPFSARPPAPPRRQSLLSTRQTTLIRTLLHSPTPNDGDGDGPVLPPIEADMVTRKIWVKRPNASPTLITVNEDDLVDDVRDLILRKYANSLGRTFDSPDLAIRICPRDQHKDRVLGPEEPVGRTLDAYFPGGQTIDEALVIDVPRRGPKASPRPAGPYAATTIYYTEDGRPSEAGEGYFPPVGGVPSPHLPVALPAQTNGAGNPPSIAVLGTGHIPPIPSPGGTRSRAYRDRPERPRLGRTHTSSPTIIGNGPSGPGAATAAASATTHDPAGMPPTAPPIPTPPAPEPTQARVATPPPRISSPRAAINRPKKNKKNAEHLSLPPGMLNGSVPPISVLIVEDNPINLKLLEAFVKRLKVRWQTAMNGRDAVTKWRSGGFHLVLMDIQLPVMNGLDATREIRRLERVNSIGVFSSSTSSEPEESNGELQDQDRLENPSLFKSPVIIVALTASSLQSDRHQALAAGCNDFLTKPVNFVWLERKVMEWGCMQALIDFDGWRKWKDFSHEADENESSKKAATTKAKSRKNRLSMSSGA